MAIFVIGIIIAVAGIVGIFVGRGYKRKAERSRTAAAQEETRFKTSYLEDADEAEDVHRVVRGFSVGAILLGVVVVVLSTMRVVPANTVGIPTEFGSIGSPKSSGFHIVTPWTKINTFSTRVQETSMLDVVDEGDKMSADAVEVRGSDGYSMRVDITVRYFIKPAAASDLYRLVGSMDGIRDRLVRPEVRESVRVIFANYTAEEGYSSERVAIRGLIEQDLKVRLDRYGLTMDAVNVRNVNPDPVLAQAISDRAAARERALQAEITQKQQVTEAETRRKVAETDAQSQIIAAQAQADANKILNASLTAELLELRRIEALEKANTVYVPVDTSVIVGQQPK